MKSGNTGRGRRARRDPLYAAIDLGTNNCRMLIARSVADGFHVVDAFSRIVRLGETLADGDALSEVAMARTIAALAVCARKAARHGVERLRGVATEACRRAANSAAFFDRIEAATGLRLETINGEEEARLALVGCLPLLDPTARRALVFDIGGGSTELAWLDCRAGPPYRITASTSLSCGVTTLTERQGDDLVGRATYEAMVAHVRGLLAPFEARHRLAPVIAEGGVQLLGTSGTVTTLAGVHLDLPRYDRTKVDGLCLDFDDVELVIDRLLGLDIAARAAIPSIGPERAEAVLAGCAILDAIHRTWPVGGLRVADRGLREGILMNMMGFGGVLVDAIAPGLGQR